MYYFGEQSESCLATCHNDLVVTAHFVIQIIDFGVHCGARNKIEQRKEFLAGNSKVDWPNSFHNVETPDLSNALDFHPYPIDSLWDSPENKLKFERVVLVWKGVAKALKIELEFGYDWGWDYPHIQRKLPFNRRSHEKIII